MVRKEWWMSKSNEQTRLDELRRSSGVVRFSTNRNLEHRTVYTCKVTLEGNAVVQNTTEIHPMGSFCSDKRVGEVLGMVEVTPFPGSLEYGLSVGSLREDKSF